MNEFEQEVFDLKLRIAELEQRQHEREMDDLRQRVERIEIGHKKARGE